MVSTIVGENLVAKFVYDFNLGECFCASSKTSNMTCPCYQWGKVKEDSSSSPIAVMSEDFEVKVARYQEILCVGTHDTVPVQLGCAADLFSTILPFILKLF